MKQRIIGACAGLLIVEAMYYFGQLCMMVGIARRGMGFSFDEAWGECIALVLTCSVSAVLLILGKRKSHVFSVFVFAGVVLFEAWFIARSVYYFGFSDSAFPGRIATLLILAVGLITLVSTRPKKEPNSEQRC